MCVLNNKLVHNAAWFIAFWPYIQLLLVENSLWIWVLTAAWVAQKTFFLCAVPAFLGKVSDLVKWGFFVWMACLAHIPYNNFFLIFKYASQTNSACVEKFQYLLWLQAGVAVHLDSVLLGRYGKGQCAMEKQQQAWTSFLQLVCFDGFTLCHQNKSDVRDAGAGRLKLARDTWRRKVVCREHCLKAYNFQRSCLQECCRRGRMIISGGCTGCTLGYTPICGMLSQCCR